jgi:hypothetical protein
MTDWVLIARNAEALAHEKLTVGEPLEPIPQFSLWTDQFNNLIDVLKSNPVEELRKLIGAG